MNILTDYFSQVQKLSINQKRLLYFPLPVAFLMPIVIAIICGLTDLDGFYFVLEELLPHPFTRERRTISLAFVARFLKNFLIASEVTRTMLHLYFLCMMAVIRLSTLVDILLFQKSTVQIKARTYNCIRIILANTYPFLDLALFIVLSFMFWTIVCSTWLSVKTSPTGISGLFYYFFCSISVFSSCLLYVLLKSACSILAKLHLVPIFNEAKARLSFTLCKSFLRLEATCIWKAIKPVVFMYGNFSKIDEDFVLILFWLISLRSVDAILLF